MDSTGLTLPKILKSDFNSSILEQSLKVKEHQRKLKRSLIWGFVNVCILGIIVYDIMNTCPINVISIILYAEYLLLVILSLNIVYHFISYINISLSTSAILLPQQQRCLGLNNEEYTRQYDSHSYSPFRTPLNVDNTPNSSFCNTPMNLSAQSWKSNMSSSFNDSQNLQSSFSCVRRSPQTTFSPNQNTNLPTAKLMPHTTCVGEFINDEQSLTEYLKGYQIYEKANSIGTTVEQPTSLLSSFWSHPAAKKNSDVPSVLKKCQYQLSPLSVGAVSNSPGKSDSTSPNSSQSQGIDLWRRLNVNSSSLTQWNANIRMWLSQTIVERLVREIDYIDEALPKHGLSDVRVGGVGLDRLRKTSQMAPVIQFIPTLSTLIPFLELHSNQEYLVKRIRELSRGGCMSDFKWNGGSSFNGKKWNESLPTDAEIIMHLFATYMDTQLLPKPNQPDVKPFSGNYFIKYSDKLPDDLSNTLAIHQFSEKPAEYRVIIGEIIYDVVKGHNNLFHTLLMFIYQVNKKELGMLGRTNLGPAGVNLLWVIDS